MPTLLLIDGHSQAYRAYFGMKTPLSTSSGELTAAVYGFARKLLSVLKEVKPDYVAVAFDLGDTAVAGKNIFERFGMFHSSVDTFLFVKQKKVRVPLAKNPLM